MSDIVLPKYIENWLKIIENMSNDNTYKLAWGRAILECIDNDKYTSDGKIAKVMFIDIAKNMVKYYWNQIFFFNLKQAPYDDRIPVICQDTLKLIDEYKKITNSNIPVWYDVGITEIQKNNNQIFNEKLCHIVKTLHENVSWRFLNIQQEKIELYFYSKENGDLIEITNENVDILKCYSYIISKLLNYKWAQLLEKFNYSPKIASKVNGISEAKLRRSSLTKFKEQLIKEFNGEPVKDFYTGEILREDDISIDHVIPWSFMYSDDIWNLVITSRSHNSSKSNSIPTEEQILRLKERNNRLLNILNNSFKEDLEQAEKNKYLEKFYYACSGKAIK